ncbi:MAG: 16S rRNA (cytosine(967)-C(5))-methyltransferase RsmB [Vulcanibacillus sp.]
MNKLKNIETSRELALEVLTKVDKEKAYSNIQLNQSLQNANLSRLDINLATEIIYGTIQRLNTIDWVIQKYLKNDIKELELWVKNLLRLSVYQIIYLDRIPSHAIVNEAVEIAKKNGHKGIASMVNGVLRNIIRTETKIKIPEILKDYEKITIEHSHPEWIVKKFINEYGLCETEEICRENNKAPFNSIRVNTLKITREKMIGLLKNELGDDTVITPSSLSKEGIRIKGSGNLATLSLYEEGFYSIQDESSMLAVDALDPKPYMTVLDATAAPGGKTTHIAEKMQNKGRIIASDIHRHKIKLIEEQKKRLGIDIIETVCIDARDLHKEYGAIFDCILLDVPCSGLGVIRRKPELKWTKSIDDITKLIKVQQNILENVSSLLKPGGILVYSTCTMTKEENQDMIYRFIKKYPEFKLDKLLSTLLSESINQKIDTSEGMLQILPHYFHTDGFFISRMVKL